jgi:hypothetical protein
MTGEMIEIVAKAIIGTMFVEHELPLEDEIYHTGPRARRKRAG